MLTFLKNNRGNMSYRQLFVMILVVVGGYFGYHFIPMEAKNYMIIQELKSEAKTAHLYSESRIELQILKRANSWNIPLERDSIFVIKHNGKVRIRLEYEYEKVFLDKKKRVFYYTPDIEVPLQKTNKELQY